MGAWVLINEDWYKRGARSKVLRARCKRDRFVVIGDRFVETASVLEGARPRRMGDGQLLALQSAVLDEPPAGGQAGFALARHLASSDASSAIAEAVRKIASGATMGQLPSIASPSVSVPGPNKPGTQHFGCLA